MVYLLLYIFGIGLFLVILAACTIYLVSMVYSFIHGSLYIATQNKEIFTILKEAHLQKGQSFLELGSGNGVVTRTAVKNYQVVGKGIDINPLLVLQSTIISKLQGLKNISFVKENVLLTDFSTANVIYIFLMPSLIEKIKQRLQTETKKGTLIISHGFKIIGWEDHLIKTIQGVKFKTYYYKT